jgi:putative protease
MKKSIELLAPGGDVDSIKAAIIAGANAVYCGLERFNARNRAKNISLNDLYGILRLAHKNNCKVFLTLNIVIVDSEIPSLIELLYKLNQTSIDGIIVQDLGVFYLVSQFFKGINIHASTQLTTHNRGQIEFLSKLNVSRVNFSRELNINEIHELANIASKLEIQTEVFVHGSYCICFSGICYFSSVQSGNSGNRGRCSQPCRDQYRTTPIDKNHPFNLKDNSAYLNLKELAEAGIDSLKIEGRIKEFRYVFNIVETWRKQLDMFYEKNKLNTDISPLYKAFNRDFTNGFLKGEINSSMFIDNPRDNSAIYLSKISACPSQESLEKSKSDIYFERKDQNDEIKKKIDQISIEKIPLTISVLGKLGNPLKISVKTPDNSFELTSKSNLSEQGSKSLDYKLVSEKLNPLNDTGYFIEKLDMDNLQPDVFIPFSEINSIKNELLILLNDSNNKAKPIAPPILKKHNNEKIKTKLSVIISSENDLHLTKKSQANFFFQIPDNIKSRQSFLIDMFLKHKQITPIFPSVIIGEDYKAAVEFLCQVKPASMVTNNLGIAFEAWQNGIKWIAGPYLNISNSFSLICLKEKYNCRGAFISNELSRVQIKSIKKPDDFELFYSICHPLLLMTSRQCLLYHVTGCEKPSVDNACIQHCNKMAIVTNLKNEKYYICKSAGNYNKIYNTINFLNTDIVNDIQNLFSGFVIDLTEIDSETQIIPSKLDLIRKFENFVNGNQNSATELHKNIFPTTNAQYYKGI